jgi:hypothetical protein
MSTKSRSETRKNRAPTLRRAKSVRFHGRRVTKVGPEVKHGPLEGWGPLNKGARGALGRCRTFQVAEKESGRFRGLG